MDKGQKPTTSEQERFAEEFKKFADVYDANAKLDREQTHAAIESARQEIRRLFEMFEEEKQNSIKSAEKVAKLQNRKMVQAVVGLVITVLIAAASFVLNDYFNRQGHEREMGRVEMKERLAKLERISEALTDVRRVKDEALLDCGTDRYNPRAIDGRRLEMRTNLVKAVRNADFFFGEDVRNAADAFTAWENSFTDYCSKDLAADSEWREKHRAIEKLARAYFPESTFKTKKQ